MQQTAGMLAGFTAWRGHPDAQVVALVLRSLMWNKSRIGGR
jgi:hypothetical protein